MKSARDWGDVVYFAKDGKTTLELIKEIQKDALEHAAMIAETFETYPGIDLQVIIRNEIDKLEEGTRLLASAKRQKKKPIS